MYKFSDIQSILMYHSVVKVKKISGLSFSKFNLQYCVLSKYKLCPCSTSLLLASNNICFQKSGDMLNKNTLDVEKVRGQSEAALQIGMCDQKL